MAVKQVLYAMDRNVNLSPTQELLFHLLEKAWGHKVKGHLSICPLTYPLAMLSWMSLFLLLPRMTEPQHLEVRDSTVLPTKWGTLMATAIDAHCNMRMLTDHLKCIPEAALSMCRQQHWSLEICSISWVVSTHNHPNHTHPTPNRSPPTQPQSLE